MFGSLFGPEVRARAPTNAATTTAVAANAGAPGSSVVYTNLSDAPQPSGGAAALPSSAGAASDDGGQTYSLNFEGVDIAAASKAILGDVLKQPYSLDPRVKGQLSLSSGRPVNARDLLFVFENALNSNGAALVKTGDAYRIVPASDAATSGMTAMAPDGQVQPGYGISILPIRYISAKTLLQLMDGFATRPGMLRIDSARNLFIIQGSSGDRAVALQSALTFDTDWMRDQTVGVFALKNSTPASLIPELQQIFDSTDNGLGQGLIKFQPIERLNAVMAVSKRRDLVQRAGLWVQRFDVAPPDAARVYVYQLHYGDAKSVADILNQMFGNAAASTSPIAPDAGTQVASSAGRTNAASPQAAAAATDTVGSISPAGSDNGTKITTDPSNNSLVIMADANTYRRIVAALQQIDQPRLQVAVHAIVAEVALTDELANGLEFYLSSKSLGFGTDKGAIGIGPTSPLQAIVPGFNFLVGAAADPNMVLHALDSITSVKVISSPSMVVMNNEKATLQVGSQVPVATREATDVNDPNAPIVNNIEFRDTGVILKVTPRISENGIVNMEIEQIISAVSKDSAAGTLTPVITQRSFTSTISVVSGQTVILGGLISQEEDATATGLPFLSRLKFLGNVGGDRDNTRKRTELVMFIQPEIIRNGVDAQRVTEEMAAKLRKMVQPDAGDVIIDK